MSSSRIPPTTMPVLVIEYAETNDDPIDHQPIVPGFTDDGIFWACVARLPGGRTRWQRIHPTRAHVTPPASRDSSLGGNEDTHDDQTPEHAKSENGERGNEDEN